MIRVTIDRVVVEGLELSEREVKDRLQTALGKHLTNAERDLPSPDEISKIVREAFDV